MKRNSLVIFESTPATLRQFSADLKVYDIQHRQLDATALVVDDKPVAQQFATQWWQQVYIHPLSESATE
jgi:hypothetical protein